MQRTSKDKGEPDLEANLADFGILSGNVNHIRLAATVLCREGAISSPTMGWSGYERMRNAARGAHLTHEALNTTHLRDLDPDTVYTRQWGADLASEALFEYGAGRVDSSEFWMLSGAGAQMRPGVQIASKRLWPMGRAHRTECQWGTYQHLNWSGERASGLS